MPEPVPSRVVVIGDALIDEIRDAGGVRELVGGAALNVAVGLTRLGIPATLIAMVGADAAGDHIRTYLHDHGVQLLASEAPLGSSRAIVTRGADGEPSYRFNEAAQGRSIRYSDAEKEALAQAAAVVVSCFPFDNGAEVDALLDAVGDRPLIVDPNPRTGMMRDRADLAEGFLRVAAGARAIKIGSDDAEILADGDLPALGERLRDNGAEIILMTAGAAGAALRAPGWEVSRPIATLPGAIVDTVGAGDATLAALVAGLVGGVPETEGAAGDLLERIMEVAAATCRGEGGLLRTPESLLASPMDRIAT